MSSYRIQFKRGLSLPEFLDRFGSEARCIEQLVRPRWPGGFQCTQSFRREPYRVSHGRRVVLECRGCARQPSLLVGTAMQHTKLPLWTWFLAMFFISPARTGLSALALKRRLGVSYRTVWLLHHKIMTVMATADAQTLLEGSVLVDVGCGQTYVVVGTRNPRELPRFTWVNTLLANLKTAFNGAHKHFVIGRYAQAYIGAFAYRFNHRVHLRSLMTELLFDLARTPSVTKRTI